MKKTKKVLSLVLAAALGMAVSPFSACDNTTESTPQGDERTTVSAIAPQLLEGKVANLMSAEGIAIQDKTQETATVSAVRTKGAVRKRYADPNKEKIEPAKNELVKKTKQGLQDVRFHGESEGDYTTWNEQYADHHHDGVVCEAENCIQLSDEVAAAEGNAPTVVSLDARVNKLYNAGRFTFLCVSTAVEGEARLFSYMQNSAENISRMYLENWGVWLNLEEHYVSETNHTICVNYVEVKSGDKQGVILVKRSDGEEGYHYANYWSDDFNQSYLIDNETGKTYSLSALPHIYSVENGIIVVKADKSAQEIYRPEIVEGELVLDKIEISSALKEKYNLSNPLVDVHGNVVFNTGTSLDGADVYGEIKEEGFIFTGPSEQVMQQIQNDRNNPSWQLAQQAYPRARRYVQGSDGQIYRFDYRGRTDSIPVHVLNAQGEWVSVPETAEVYFFGDNRWFMEQTINMTRMQYVLLNCIRGGRTYFANAAGSGEVMFTSGADYATYKNKGSFVGITALPTDGSADTQMQAFMNGGTMASGGIAYAVGNTAFAYEDVSNNQLVIWDRATGTRTTVGFGQPIEGLSGQQYLWVKVDGNISETCFQANTADGVRYVAYDEQNPLKAWNEYSTTPIVQTENLDAYYQLLLGR